MTAMLLVMLGITEGMRNSLVDASTTLMSGHVNVAGFFKVTSGQAAPVVTHAAKVREVVEHEVRSSPTSPREVAAGRGW